MEQLEQTLESYARDRARASLDGDFRLLDKYWPAGQAGRPGLRRVEKEREALRRAEQSGRTGRTDMGWWYRHRGGPQDQWSLSWAVAHSLRWYLAGSRQALRAEQASDPRLLVPGDVVHYDFDGDGVWEHTTVVVGLDPGGEPLVNAHTAPSRRRPWRYADSPAWTSRTRYLFWHVLDRF